MKSTILLILIVLLLPPIVAADQISFYENQLLVNIDSIKYTTILIFNNKPREHLEIPLFFQIDNFKSKANFNNYFCENKKESWGSTIVCNFENVSDNVGSINFEFETKSNIKRSDNSYFFETNLKAPLNISKMILRIKLEEGLVLSEKSNLKTFSPKNGVKGSDGRRIFVEWTKENVPKDDGIIANVFFEQLPTYTSGEDLSLFYILFGVIVVLIAEIFFYRTRQGGIKSAITILKEDERRVIEILEELGGKAKQKQIQDKGDFSKATLSRLIKNLEERGLIKTERLGRSNKIYLNKTIDQKEIKEKPEVEINPDNNSTINPNR